MLHDIWYRVRSLVRRNAAEAELTEELRHHLDLEAAKYRNSGMDEVAAMRLARARFGGGEQPDRRGYSKGDPRTICDRGTFSAAGSATRHREAFHGGRGTPGHESHRAGRSSREAEIRTGSGSRRPHGRTGSGAVAGDRS